MPSPTPSQARVRAALEAFKAAYPDDKPVIDIDAAGRLIVRPVSETDHGETGKGWGDVAA